MSDITLLPNGINPKELTKDSYVTYCKLYLTDRIHAVIPITCPLTYRHISKVFNIIPSNMFLSINNETGKILLINKIYSIFMEIGEFEVYREFLHGLLDELDLSKYNPDLYRDELMEMLNELRKNADDLWNKN